MSNDAAVAVIQFVMRAGLDGLEFLSLWNEGEFDVCRAEWPEAPAECYIGADPLIPQQGAEQTAFQCDSLPESVIDTLVPEALKRFTTDPHPEPAWYEFAHAVQAEVLARVRLAAVLPQVGEAKPIYMVSFVGLHGASESGVWREASEEAFHTFAEAHRRIVYAAPASLGEATAVALFDTWKYRQRCVGGGVTEWLYMPSLNKGADFQGCNRYRVRDDCFDWTPLFAAPVAEALPVAAEKLLTYEQRHAIKEGERNAASSEYFRARTPLMNTSANLSIFDAGFDRGFDAAKQWLKS